MTHTQCRIIATGAVDLHHAPDPALKQRVAANARAIDAIWDQARSKGDILLYNGSLLVYTGHETISGRTRVTGHFAEYKHFIAHRNDPALGLDINPIGVSGLVTGLDRGESFTVFARRAPNCSTYGGYYELVPSGAIALCDALPDGRVDFARRLLLEFEEEVGPVPEAARCAVSPMAFLHDASGGVYDVCCLLETDLAPAFFKAHMAQSEEYSGAECVPLSNAREFASAHISEIIPTTLGILDAFFSQRK